MTEDGSAGTGTSGKKASVNNSRSSKGLCLHYVTDAPHLSARSLSLDIVNDDDCKRVPTLGPLVEQVLADAAQVD